MDQKREENSFYKLRHHHNRLQNSPYFSARVGLNLARKGSGTSMKIMKGIGERRTISWEKERLFCSLPSQSLSLFHRHFRLALNECEVQVTGRWGANDWSQAGSTRDHEKEKDEHSHFVFSKVSRAVISSWQVAIVTGNCSEDGQLLKVWKWIKYNSHGRLSGVFNDQLLSLYSRLLQSLMTALSKIMSAYKAITPRLFWLNCMVLFSF